MGSIEVSHLTKWYVPGSPILDDVSFREEGCGAVGYLGPNGAGKTTTLKLLLGLLQPSAGSVRLNDLDPAQDRRRALARVGAIVESPEPYPSETIYDALERVGALRGLDASGIDDEIDRCHRELHLPPLEWPCGWLSKGERQRVVLAAACLGDPAVLLLDEPTNGMDPAERVEVRGFLKRLKRDHLILMSSHLIADVSAICDRLIFLDRGKIRLRASADEVASLVRVDAVDVEFVRPTELAALEGLQPWVRKSVRLGDRRYRFRFDGQEETLSRLLEECGRVGPLLSFTPSVPALEAVYRQVITDAPDREA
ncbi:MAG: ABC transporter ATP-binding protein [Thermoplasmata archaeon]|nr:ABC transporter ATP-binding protein [Thermoplasmata archaeon]